MDPTGQINIVFWQDQVDSIAELKERLSLQAHQSEEKINLENAVSICQEMPPLNLKTFYLKYIIILHDIVTTIDAIVCGVKEMSFYKACFSCTFKVEVKNTQGNCLKCRMMVNLTLCTNQCYL